MPTPYAPLRLYEEILLLGLRARAHTLGSPSQLALAGAILAELLVAGSVTVEVTSRMSLVTPGSGRVTGDELIDGCLAELVTASRRAALQTWVARWGRMRHLQDRATTGLCRRGILRGEERTFLGVFRHTSYPELEPGPELAIRHRMIAAIQSETDEIDPRTVVLISLAFHAGLLPGVAGRALVKRRYERVRRLIEGEVMGLAVRASLEGMNAALVAAAVIPALVASTTS